MGRPKKVVAPEVPKVPSEVPKAEEAPKVREPKVEKPHVHRRKDR